MTYSYDNDDVLRCSLVRCVGAHCDKDDENHTDDDRSTADTGSRSTPFDNGIQYGTFSQSAG